MKNSKNYLTILGVAIALTPFTQLLAQNTPEAPVKAPSVVRDLDASIEAVSGRINTARKKKNQVVIERDNALKELAIVKQQKAEAEKQLVASKAESAKFKKEAQALTAQLKADDEAYAKLMKFRTQVEQSMKGLSGIDTGVATGADAGVGTGIATSGIKHPKSENNKLRKSKSNEANKIEIKKYRAERGKALTEGKPASEKVDKSHCPEGTECTSEEECKSHCPEGTECTSEEECKSHCAEGTECASGEECKSHCAEGTECASGEECKSHCAEGTECASEEECKSHCAEGTECASGEECKSHCSEVGVCTPEKESKSDAPAESKGASEKESKSHESTPKDDAQSRRVAPVILQQESKRLKAHVAKLEQEQAITTSELKDTKAKLAKSQMQKDKLIGVIKESNKKYHLALTKAAHQAKAREEASKQTEGDSAEISGKLIAALKNSVYLKASLKASQERVAQLEKQIKEVAKN